MPIVSGIPTRCNTHNQDFLNYHDALIHCYEDDNTTHELQLDVPEGTVIASPDPDRITHA